MAIDLSRFINAAERDRLGRTALTQRASALLGRSYREPWTL